ncbi:PQQ-binding-like beta-propeller repeat protein [Streptomyces olivochromogenes]|uniref:outer membrane protein assembly factor BamB family protein n=1 Tax=Streptomyces olivochromogenes TaxID=1963 RepID=UPI0036DF51E9
MALDAATGQERWRLTSLPFNSSPVVVDGTVYIGSGRQLWALDAVTGRERWKCATDYVQGTRPVVADGRVYVSFPCESLRAVDAATGSKLWEAKNYASPVVADGTLYSSRATTRSRDQCTVRGLERWSDRTAAWAGSDPSRLTAGAAGAAGGADGLAGTACGPARNRQENATDTAIEVRFGSTGSGEAVRIEQWEGFATGQAATEFPPGTARGAGRCEQAVLTGLEHRLALGRALLRSRLSPHAPQGGSYSADSPHGLPLPGAADTVGRATGIEWRAVPASGSRWVRRAAPGALGRRHGLRLSLTSRA